MAKLKNSWEASSWEELMDAVSLDEVLSALKAKEIQRLAHKKQYLKRQAVLQRAKQEHPDWF